MTLKRYQQEGNLPERFKTLDREAETKLEQNKRTAATTDPMFKTSYMELGQLKPSSETMPRSYHGLNTRFTAKMTKHGMYRNHSVNL